MSKPDNTIYKIKLPNIDTPYEIIPRRLANGGYKFELPTGPVSPEDPSVEELQEDGKINIVLFNTQEYWDRTEPAPIMSKQGVMYVYIDGGTYGDEDELNSDPTIKTVQKVKIGDGINWLLDLPFLVDTYDLEEILRHIQNISIHVSADDRTFWNNKITTKQSVEDGVLEFTTGYVNHGQGNYISGG